MNLRRKTSTSKTAKKSAGHQGLICGTVQNVVKAERHLRPGFLPITRSMSASYKTLLKPKGI